MDTLVAYVYIYIYIYIYIHIIYVHSVLHGFYNLVEPNRMQFVTRLYVYTHAISHLIIEINIGIVISRRPEQQLCFLSAWL